MIDWKRAVMIGIALWVLIFFEVSILMFGFKLNAPDPNYYLIHTLLLTAFILILSIVYFNGKTLENQRFSGSSKQKNKKILKKVKNGFGEGIVLGIVFVVVGVILDSVITIPLFIIPQGGSYTSFLFSVEMLLGYLEIIVLSGIVGLIKR